MTATLVDTNVFIDVFGPPGKHRGWSLSGLKDAVFGGGIVLSAIIWSELAGAVASEVELNRMMAWLRPIREDFPFHAAFSAGVAHALYRKRGGLRERTLPDFLIGAHALAVGHRLLTRDAARYRSYFPGLDIVAPDVRP